MVEPSKQPNDFRLYLQTELVRRCDKNPKYSLRAFARSLGTDHSTLSAILSGKRPLTKKSIQRYCEALQLSPTEASAFCAQDSDKITIPEYQQLSLDVFTAISEWYYDAIVELTKTKNFVPDYKWVAKRIGISVSEVKIAVERLQRLELLKVTTKGWFDLSPNNTTNVSNDLTSAALRKLQKRLLEKSIESLDTVSRQHRDHTSMVVAIQKADLEQVKALIKKFRFKLTAFLERAEVKPDSVYQLAVSFYPLTNEEGK